MREVSKEAENREKRENRKIIALVEDDARLANMYSDVLSLSGQWQLHVFSDGESARDQLPHIGADLILLDVGLPHLDGASLYKILRGHSSTKHTPIIVITGSYDWQLHRMGLQSGFLLHKPFSIQELLDLIQALM